MADSDPAAELLRHLSDISDSLRAIADAANRIQLTLLDAGVIAPVVAPSFEVECEGFVRRLDDAAA
jgi:hypothetical protein